MMMLLMGVMEHENEMTMTTWVPSIATTWSMYGKQEMGEALALAKSKTFGLQRGRRKRIKSRLRFSLVSGNPC